MNNKYNGWANYATWRVQLEIVSDLVEMECRDDMERAKALTVDEWREMIEYWVDEAVFLSHHKHDNFLMMSYAEAFLSYVDYYELAISAKERADEMEECKSCQK